MSGGLNITSLNTQPSGSRELTQSHSVQDHVGDVPPASDAWRKKEAFRATRSTIPELNIGEYIEDNKREAFRHISAATFHDKNEYVALGGTTDSRDKLTIVKFKSVSKIEVACKIKCPLISDLSWVGTKLLCGTTNGSVLLYNADPTAKKIITPHDEEKVNEYVYKKPSDGRPPPAPGKMVTNNKVNRVSLNPTDHNLFLSLENLNLHIWDVEQLKDPILTKQLSSYAPYYAADWSPFVANKFIIGGMKRNLKIVDLRLFDNATGNSSKPYVWKRNDAHKETIRDVKWSPFVPHWVASCGEAGAINIWDLRFNSKPCVALEDHSNAISSISWSASHSDILVSGGSDRQMKIWNLNLKPHRVAASVTDFMSSLVGVGFSRSEPYVCFGASLNGQLTGIELKPEFLEPLIQSRFTIEEKEERDVEHDIYFRNFATGFNKAYQLAQKLKNASKFENALHILELCYERIPPDPEAEPLTTNTTAAKTFEEDLKQYSYFIPPNFPDYLSKTADPAVTGKIELLKLSLELFKFVHQNAGDELLERAKEICDLIQNNPDSISNDVLVQVLETTSAYDYLRSLQFAQDLGSIFKTKNKWNDFIPIAKLALHPTIYENLSDKPATQLTTALTNSNDILDQIDFLKEVTKMQWSANPEDDDEFVSFFEDHRPKLVLSSSLQRIYINALLQKHQYARCYVYSTSLIKNLEGFEFQAYLTKTLKTEWFTRLQDYVQECQVGLQSSSDQPWECVKYYDSVVEIVKVLETCESLPSSVTSYLPPNLNQLTLDLEAALLELKKVNTASSNKTKIQAAKEAKRLANEVDSVLKGKVVNKQWKKEVNALVSMLKSF